VLDVRSGLPYSNVHFLFAEHFIEHLSYDAGIEFLGECRRVLSDSGVIRLSTPNLDWVWLNQYHPHSWRHDGEAVRDCFWMNRAFHGWGHQFLYNLQTLSETIREAGFAEVRTVSYGQSTHPELRDLEQHEEYIDTPEVPHVIVVEASGRAASGSKLISGPRAEYDRSQAP
jgi:predicted SAM-dependent methyltransferase